MPAGGTSSSIKKLEGGATAKASNDLSSSGLISGILKVDCERVEIASVSSWSPVGRA